MSQRDLDAFRTECLEFLNRFPRREVVSSDFVWGAGHDAVALFEEADREAERAQIDELRRWRAELARSDLSWIGGPTEYGGRALPSRFQRLFDQLARDFDVPASTKLTVSLGMVAPTILAHGTPGAKDRYLRALFGGELIGCQLFSEPGAGSDLASVATRATRSQDGASWTVSGQKVWTSGAHYSDIGLLLTRTSDGPRHANLTAFVVDMHAPGVEVRPLRQMTGGAAFNEVFLDEVAISDENRLGEVDGGWKVAMTTLMNERGAIGGAGVAGAGLLSTARLRELVRQFGLEDDTAVRLDFGRLMVGLRTAHYAGRVSDAQLRAGHTPGPELSLSKLRLVANLASLNEFVASVLEGRLTSDTGEWGTYAWSTFSLGLPGYRVGGGTDEVLRNIIAERVLDLPREPSVK